MATNIEINEKLVQEAMAISGKTTKRAVVNQALEEFVQHHKQQGILEMFGQVHYHPDADYKTARKRGIRE